MPKLSHEIPNDCTIAISGGLDSVFADHFVRIGGKRNVDWIYFNHNTQMAHVFEYFVRTLANLNGLKLTIVNITGNNEKEWRDARYEYLFRLSGKVITAHHADDNEETRLMRQRDIPSVNRNIIRPFLNWRKVDILKYAEHHDLMWVEDPTNKIGFTKRNVVRNELIPLMNSLGISYVQN